MNDRTAPDRYDPSAIESKWQSQWETQGLYVRSEDPEAPYYALTMYPYPSGNLHIGHWYAYSPSDANARYHRMQGRDVFFPIGFDAFGLPAENAAIKHGAHPRKWTMANIEQMRRQFRSMGTMFDWTAEIVTCEPDYYRWNQWFFLQFLEQGLAYRKRSPVDWCPNCNTTLAREQVVGEARLCERCDTPVVKRDLEQWYLRITDYADELLTDLDDLDWPERVKTMQRNWIGRSVGSRIEFSVEGADVTLPVFTTRPDTLFGASAVVLAPEHPDVDAITADDERSKVAAFRAETTRQTEIDRLAADRPKSGVPTGATARHPISGAALPVWVADYVLPTYGTGAVMLVPAHDERDMAFARRYGLPTPVVVTPANGPSEAAAEAYTEPGRLVNSGEFSGLVSLGKYTRDEWTQELAEAHGLPTDLPDGQEAKEAITAALADKDAGGPAVSYRLRDWLVSRQRYWGTPIPVIHCDRCGLVPVPESDLPVELPDGVAFLPTGESPLKFADAWLTVVCPECGGSATRDTDTMDTFVDSSWYQYRYLSPDHEAGPFDPAETAWLPVAQYTGGIEHATMHLLYTRFWTKVMRDMGLIDFDEPMLRLFNQGIILGEDSEKMSKSRGNVVDPDALVAEHGADAVRAYLMFIGPWDQGGPWDPRGMQGLTRFLDDVWQLAHADGVDVPAISDENALRKLAHQTLERVTTDMEGFAYNTAIAALMEFRNGLKEHRASAAGSEAWHEAIELLLKMLAPIAPHITEELWARRGYETSIHLEAWPAVDTEAAAETTVEIGIQVRGKLRDRVTLPADVSEEAAVRAAMASPAVQRELNGSEPRRVIYVPGRLVNIVP